MASVHSLRNAETIERAWAVDMERLGFELGYWLHLWGQVISFLWASTIKWTRELVIHWKCLVQCLTPRMCFINANVPIPSLILCALLYSRELYPLLEVICLNFFFLPLVLSELHLLLLLSYVDKVGLTPVSLLSFSYLPSVACWWHSDIWPGSVCSLGWTRVLTFPWPTGLQT